MGMHGMKSALKLYLLNVFIVSLGTGLGAALFISYWPTDNSLQAIYVTKDEFLLYQHRQAQEVVEPEKPHWGDAREIAKKPNDLPPPISRDYESYVRYTIEVGEVTGFINKNTTFTYWTYNKTVPGPMLRVREGDTVEITFVNPAGSAMLHSVDFHATTGPGGGATVTQTYPNSTSQFTWKAMNPGVFVYHCASPYVPLHISKGMYGMIVVEPKYGLPPVDKEFYVMQGEMYTTWKSDVINIHQTTSPDKEYLESADYVVFNGRVGALIDFPLKADVGETVRIFMGVGGPNLVSSFHVIGEIFDRVYNLGAIASPPLQQVQSVLVPAGGSAVVEFQVDYPGKFTLVDHSLTR
eukprot:TRINITY_DN4848_c0_g1_i16.p1 TRINITY_DN4848_c0_g1~~TRINITY_DN4848_c0_g1_i16.p1  ORF type:complete len:352 (-),score=50.46 TRINITY_DN4848_c0_g1_i16:79-1134(-)